MGSDLLANMLNGTAVLLACAYPVVEVVFSVVRRIRRAHPLMPPDRLHLHTLVKCRVARKQLLHWPAGAWDSGGCEGDHCPM